MSSTPGKTKHFQTIHLSPTLVLCDCPGLVFPQFATTKADLVCDGVLPIDQMREYTGPIALVVKRIPKEVLEAVYGLTLRTKGVEEGGDGKISGTDLLVAYASALFVGGILQRILRLDPCSCSWFHAIWTGQPRRGARSAVHPEGLRQREASVLPSAPWNTRGPVQRGYAPNRASACNGQEAGTHNSSRQESRYIRCASGERCVGHLRCTV